MEYNAENCPCKRVKCQRHGDCAACRAHHGSTVKKNPTACDRLEKKRERKLASTSLP